ncbi:hypothetical protein ANCCAN_20320, partial [Ancylostoma caninum]
SSSVLLSANATYAALSRNVLFPDSAEHIRRNCRLSCYIVATSNADFDRLAAINETWLTRCDHGHFFTNEHSDLSVPASALFSSSKSNFTASYKAKLSLRYAYYNLSSKSDWYYLASDDTYVIVENMCQYLATLNPNKPYFAAVTESELQSSGNTATDNDGAMEYVLSRAGLEHLMEATTKECSLLSDEGFDLGREMMK